MTQQIRRFELHYQHHVRWGAFKGYGGRKSKSTLEAINEQLFTVSPYFSHYFGIEYINNMLVDTIIYMIYFGEKCENVSNILFRSFLYLILLTAYIIWHTFLFLILLNKIKFQRTDKNGDD